MERKGLSRPGGTDPDSPGPAGTQSPAQLGR
jgi:hypothetical protein